MSRASSPGIAKRLLWLLWPRDAPALKVRVVAAAALTLAAKVVVIAAPFAYKAVVDAMSDKAVAAAPVMLILAYGLAQFGAEAVGAVRQLIFAEVSLRAVRQTVIEVFRHLHSLSLRFHLGRQTGGLFRTIERGASGLDSLLDLALFEVLPVVLELGLVAAVLWRVYSAGLAATALAAVLTYLGFTILATRWQTQARQAMNRRDVAASAKAMDSLLNYETVKYFNGEAAEIARFDAARRDYQKEALRYQALHTLIMLGQGAIIGAGSIAVMLLAARGVATRAMTVGDFVLVNAYLVQLYAPISMLGASYQHLRRSLADVEAMDALLQEPVEITDAPAAAALMATQGRVVFDRVNFAYDPRRSILRDLSFEIPAGKTVAVVGATGSGKSTLTRLLFRFYDVGEGSITIDGQDIRQVTQASLREAIGVVPQDTVLFNDTIYANIAYGRAGATSSEVEEAARLAHIHDFIARLPEGYQTQVGERGLKLSGGEKQRVAIARVFLRQPKMLILDEATSALDTRTEQEIQASLREISANRSTLVIAHRLSTIVDADEILVMDAGRIVERGRHEALVAAGGVYAGMWTRQRRAAARGEGRRVEEAALPAE